MPISRRDLFRSAGAVGGAAILGGSRGLAADAVAGTGLAGPGARTTRGSTLVKGSAGPSGWIPVVRVDGESHVVRTNLGIEARRGRRKRRQPLLAFAQLSDVHMCDAESPMRLEYAEAASSSAHRPQEILSLHIADAMVRQLNSIAVGPVTRKPIDLAIQTGDNSDNTQHNEVRWNIDVFDGGEVTPGSGDPTRYEGVMDGTPEYYNPDLFWHPEGSPAGKQDDRPRAQFGFPTIPGLLQAARAPFQAEGLSFPWYTCIGNHDPLVQGNWSATPGYHATSLGTSKQTRVGVLVVEREVSPDPDRKLLSRAEWVQEHFTTTGLPVGHGLTEENRTSGTAYYSFDRGLVRFIVLDSVNPNGFDTGSLDQTQFHWLKDLLEQSRRRLVVLASHHTIDSMTNAFVGSIDPQPRIVGSKVRAELLRHECVIAWVNGHTHRNQVWAHRRRGGGGFWEINTASHIDWPQQSRLLEIADNKDGTVSIFATMVDHAGPESFDGNLTDPVQLAALARELAANDWQGRTEERRGRRQDRNVELLVRAPRFLR